MANNDQQEYKISVLGRILLVTLAISFIAMVAFLQIKFGMSDYRLLVYVLFGIALTAAAWSSLKSGKLQSVPSEYQEGVAKSIIASFALAFALWILVSLMLLPFIGFSGFDIMTSIWFSLAWIISAALLYPFTKRYIK